MAASSPGLPAVDGLTVERIRAEHAASAAIAVRTPIVGGDALADVCDGEVVLKAECLQRTGSFKLRGALAKIRALGERAQGGVVAGSAGNHARAIAYAARAAGAPCEIHMPASAPVSKVDAVRALDAELVLGGASVDECVRRAHERAAGSGMSFAHPFDDPDVIAGQAGVGVELVEQVADLAKVVVPIGGGGLAAGIALAVKASVPGVEIVGVQAEACTPVIASLAAGVPVEGGSVGSIADGIAIKSPSELTLGLLERLCDEVVTVSEESIAAAMGTLVEHAKLVVEGAGAVSLAALACGAIAPSRCGRTVAVLSGGNVDATLLAGVIARGETEASRRSRLYTRISDRPGALARLLGTLGDAAVNVIAVEHVRDGVSLGVRETGIALTVETRGAGHTEAALEALGAAGYEVRLQGAAGARGPVAS